jgi:hypothetical protein
LSWRAIMSAGDVPR